MKKQAVVQTDPSNFSAEQRALIEKTLIQGGTFEDAVEAVDERGKGRVSLGAVQSFFRSNLKLQRRRIRHQMKVAETVKKALGDPESGQKALAEAVVSIGLLGLNRKGSELPIQDAVTGQMQTEKIKQTDQTIRLQGEKLELDRSSTDVRIKSELLKMQVARKKLDELKKTLEKKGKRHQLSPETIRKIQEIYGIFDEPSSAPTDGENSTVQP